MADSITFGSPHVLRAHVGALSTCGAWPPNEIRKNPHPENGYPFFLLALS